MPPRSRRWLGRPTRDSPSGKIKAGDSDRAVQLSGAHSGVSYEYDDATQEFRREPTFPAPSEAPVVVFTARRNSISVLAEAG